MISTAEVKKQSECAYNQWAPQWRKHCEIHSRYKMKSMQEFHASGVGKAVLCVANGYSFEENIETIKELQDNVDILCCDKTLGHLLRSGITPQFCMVADANVSYSEYLEPYKDQLQDTILFINVCGNPEWTEKGNWKDRFFFANKDVIQSEKEFMAISGCPNMIPAGTNVSNAMVILLTQNDERGRIDFFAYDKILLIGYDYSWRFDGKYYSFNETGDMKANYMRHQYLTDQAGKYCYSSNNLVFSARWLSEYAKATGINLVQCSKNTIMYGIRFGDLREQMSYTYRREDRKLVRELCDARTKLLAQAESIKNKLTEIGRDHQRSFLATT